MLKLHDQSFCDCFTKAVKMLGSVIDLFEVIGIFISPSANSFEACHE